MGNITGIFCRWPSIIDNLLSGIDFTLNINGGLTVNLGFDLGIDLRPPGAHLVFNPLGDILTGCPTVLEECTAGITFVLEIKFEGFHEGDCFWSSGAEIPGGYGFSLFYRFGSLQVAFKTLTQEWYATLPQVAVDVFYRFEFSWSLNQGLEVYINTQLVTTVTIGEDRTTLVDDAIPSDVVLIGQCAGGPDTNPTFIIGDYGFFDATVTALIELNILPSREYTL